MNNELQEIIKDLQNNPQVKCGSYEFVGDSNITYADIYNLLEYIRILESQLQSKKQELNGFVTTISKYLELEEPEHTTYDEIIEKIVNLKGSKIKLQQRDSIIEDAIKKVKDYILELNKQIEILEKKEDRINALIIVAIKNSFYSVEELLERNNHG